MTIRREKLYEKKGTHRMAQVRTSPTIKGEYVVFFYYDNYSDFEWKRGAGGTNCDICKTLEQAKRKANNNVKKDNQ